MNSFAIDDMMQKLALRALDHEFIFIHCMLKALRSSLPMLCDQTTIAIIAGKGGNGCVHFMRAKYVPRGGPDGGDGGKGGDIIFQADENCRTLIDLHRQRIIKAQEGENGNTMNKRGKSGQDLILIVPTGTMIYDKNKKKLLADLTKHGQQFIAAKGGKGGFGNTHFKSSRYQAPKFAELGEPGERKEITLELRLIADVGIIGLPSAGKSSLLNRITKAQAKTAPYPFTTLIPNLGVVDLRKKLGDETATFIAADIPGLIEGAHAGKGLGHEFLRHITRTKILIHVIDSENENPALAKKTIENELVKFDKNLRARSASPQREEKSGSASFELSELMKTKKKKQIIAFNKIDLLDDERRKILRKKWKKAFFISAATGEGIDELLKETLHLLREEEKMEKIKKKEQMPEYKIFRPYEESEKTFEINKLKKREKIGYYQITGKRIEQVAAMTNILQPEGVIHLRHLIKKLGIQRVLLREGAENGDVLFIGDKEIAFKII